MAAVPTYRANYIHKEKEIMHAVIRTVKINPQNMEQVIDDVDTQFLGILSEMPGFVSYYMVQTGKDEVISVSIFESEEQAQESNKAAMSWIKENLGPYVTAPVQSSEGKIAVHGGN